MAIAYLQKLRDLEDGGADVQIPHGLARDWSPRMGVTDTMDSHPGGTVLHNYSKVKEKGNETVASDQWSVVSRRGEEQKQLLPAAGEVAK
jgi:hypothetical protein